MAADMIADLTGEARMTEKTEDERLRERIRRVIHDVVGSSPGSDDENLRDIGVDSFRLIELATALEAEFSISIPDEHLHWCSLESVGRISETVAKGIPSNEVEKL
jgi:acyl carrier protein